MRETTAVAPPERWLGTAPGCRGRAGLGSGGAGTGVRVRRGSSAGDEPPHAEGAARSPHPDPRPGRCWCRRLAGRASGSNEGGAGGRGAGRPGRPAARAWLRRHAPRHAACRAAGTSLARAAPWHHDVMQEDPPFWAAEWAALTGGPPASAGRCQATAPRSAVASSADTGLASARLAAPSRSGTRCQDPCPCAHRYTASMVSLSAGAVSAR